MFVFFHRGLQWCWELRIQNSPKTTLTAKSLPVLIAKKNPMLLQGGESVSNLHCCHQELLCYFALSFSTLEFQNGLWTLEIEIVLHIQIDFFPPFECQWKYISKILKLWENTNYFYSLQQYCVDITDNY